MFYRVYLKSDGNTFRGAKSDASPKDDEFVWYNPDTGIIVHDHPSGLRTSYHVSGIGGNNFLVHFFEKNNQAIYKIKGKGVLSFDELFVRQSDPIDVGPAPAAFATVEELGPLKRKKKKNPK